MSARERTPAYVGLGSNLDDPAAQLRSAFEALARLPGTRLERRSRLYRTPPWGKLDQPEFVNAVALLHTAASPRELLHALQALERDAGRQRTERWGPRRLDLDLLLYGDPPRTLARAGLVLPHPELARRAFVLLPLAELAPDLEVPGQGRVRDLLAEVDCSGIEALG